jgi:phospholipase D1/2
VSEIRQLHLDAISSARRTIFAENQYFTSRLITDAFSERLRKDDDLEIAVLSPFKQSGWLEISTMGVLRGRNHRRLREADPKGRYKLYYPTLPWLDAKGECLNIHSKVFVVDDELLMIGFRQSGGPLDGHRHRMQPRDRGARRSCDQEGG